MLIEVEKLRKGMKFKLDDEVYVVYAVSPMAFDGSVAVAYEELDGTGDYYLTDEITHVELV